VEQFNGDPSYWPSVCCHFPPGEFSELRAVSVETDAPRVRLRTVSPRGGISSHAARTGNAIDEARYRYFPKHKASKTRRTNKPVINADERGVPGFS
jgi:hypothetical protein